MPYEYLKAERALPCNIRAFILALEETYGCAFGSVAENCLSATLPSSASIEVDAPRALIRIFSPLDKICRYRTADEVYVDLLWNFPEAALAGAAVRVAPALHALELVQETALRAQQPRQIVHQVKNHCETAAAFNAWLRHAMQTVCERPQRGARNEGATAALPQAI